MSDFGNMKKVKTRKPHRCEYCQRIIPIGFTAYNCRGMWDNEWQNWYSCDFCEGNDYISEFTGESICGGEFFEWMRDQSFAYCSKCGEQYDDWDWSENEEDLVFECLCGEKWMYHIGFEAQEGV